MNQNQKNLIQGALDTLALALAEHDHTWTEGEKAIYEEASAFLGNESYDFIEVEESEEGEEWKD
jgi:hypothetical protein